jgi:hypothetical protein
MTHQEIKAIRALPESWLNNEDVFIGTFQGKVVAAQTTKELIVFDEESGKWKSMSVVPQP